MSVDHHPHAARRRSGLRPHRNGERGFTLILMTASAVALLGVLGTAVDIGRMFIAKTETQAFCDSAALAATLQLNGTTNGIKAAQDAVAKSVNAWNLDSTSVTSPQSNQPVAAFQVDFATTAAGPWSSSPNPAAGYIYSRVQVTAPVNLYFIAVVVSQQMQNVNAIGIAGQIAQAAVPRGLGPFSAVSTNTTGDTFGLVVGTQYDIQWPAFNGTRAGCTPSTPDACFVQPPCGGDPAASKSAVSQYWAASTDGYWGSNANSTISQEVLDVIQLQPVAVNQYITMSSGNKNAEASALDTRVNEDGDLTHNDPLDYQNSPTSNGRRIIPLPIVDPTSNGTLVLGYGSFLLLSNGSPSNFYTSGNGNAPYCAVYVGSSCKGCKGSGGSTSTGFFEVKLVQ